MNSTQEHKKIMAVYMGSDTQDDYTAKHYCWKTKKKFKVNFA